MLTLLLAIETISKLLDCGRKIKYDVHLSIHIGVVSALAITPSLQQNIHDFTDGRKNMKYIFHNYVCSASHMCPGRQFQNV